MQKAILITGAGSGIGRATAVHFAQQGWWVGAFDRDAPALDSLAAELGAAAGLFMPLDVTDRDALIAALDAFGHGSGGRLDILFNNAGIDAKGAFVDTPWERLVKVIDVNLIAGMSLIHAAWPLLKATPGSICISTASASAIFGVAGMAAYSASKHGIKGLTEALSVEFAAAGVRAADILPGIIDTGMLTPEHKAALPSAGMWRPLPASAVAEAVMAAYEGDRLHYYVPTELAEFDAAQTRDPETVRDQRIAGKMLG